MRIAGRTFVVTGAGNGIGREVTLRLLATGAHVAGVDRDGEALAVTSGIASAGTRLTTHEVDITDRDAVAALVDPVVSAHGAVDGLVNVAGVIQKFVRVIDLPYEEVEKVMRVNFWGTLHTIKTFLPLLVARPQAAVVNVASMGAYAPVPGQAVYGASKAAVALLTEALYAELLGTGVAVTTVYPGAIRTGIAAHSGVDMARASRASDRVRKTTPPDEAARVIVEAIQKGRFRATIGTDAAFLDKLARVSPRRAARLIGKQMGDLLG